MNIFCTIFGHTLIQETQAPDPHWVPTKSTHHLAPEFEESEVRHFNVCRRCGERTVVVAKQNDGDRPGPGEA